MTEEEADRGSAEEAMARVTERLRLARKWCDRAGSAEGGRGGGHGPCGCDFRRIRS